MQKDRLTLTDSLSTAVQKMFDGNIGAYNALVQIAEAAKTVDPQSAMGSFGPLLTLDGLGIYGPDIYVLWSDLCGRDATKTIAVLRGVQLGIVSGEILKSGCAQQDYSIRKMIDVDDVYRQVKERLTEFA